MRFSLLLSLLTAAALSACTTAPEPDTSLLTACEDPRPQVCTMIYMPVCAAHADGRRETLASACNACADATVTGYEAGPCDVEGAL